MTDHKRDLLNIFAIVQKVRCIALMSLESIDGLDVSDHNKDRAGEHQDEGNDAQEADDIQANEWNYVL